MTEVASAIERRLSLVDKKTLCEAMLRIPMVKDPAYRDLYIRQLTNELPGWQSPTRYADANADILMLVDACAEHAGGIQQLLDIMEVLHPGPSLVALRVVVESLYPKPLLVSTERVQLVRILRDAHTSIISASYRHAAPSSSGTPPDFADLESVVLRVESYASGPAGPPPVFHFVDHAAHQLDLNEREALHRWLRLAGGRLGHGQPVINSLCELTDRRLGRRHEYYFVIQVMPDTGSDDRYLLSAWHQKDAEPEVPVFVDDQPLSEADTIKGIERLIRDSASYVDTDGEFGLELILPRGLITEPVDQWRTGGLAAHSVGTTRTIVLRSLDRLLIADIRGLWRRKWRWVVTHAEDGHPRVLHYVQTQESEGYEELRAFLITDEPPVVLGMGSPPVAVHRLGPDAFTAGVDAGVPVLVWCREPALVGVFEDTLRAVIREHGLAGLPVELLRLRRLADQRRPDAPPHVGRHISLVWDDYDRIPAQFRRAEKLQSPRQRIGGPS